MPLPDLFDIVVQLGRLVLGKQDEIPYSVTQVICAAAFVLMMVLMFVACVVVAVIAWILRSPNLLLDAEILLCASLLGSLPGLSLILEAVFNRTAALLSINIAFVGLLFAFSLGVMHLPITNPWPCFAFGLGILLFGGAKAVKHYKQQTIEQLAVHNPEAVENSELTQGDLEAQVEILLPNGIRKLERALKDEIWLYIAFPIGILIGLVQPHRISNRLSIVSSCIESVFVLSAALIMVFLFLSFRRMCNPKALSELEDLEIDTGTQRSLDNAANLTELRKIDLANSVHDCMLLIAFVGLVFLMRGYTHSPDVGKAALVACAAAIVSVTLLNQLPYTIGQLSMHKEILKAFHGWERAETVKKLNEIVPAVPKLEVIAAFIGEASVGGLVFSLAKSIHEAIETFGIHS